MNYDEWKLQTPPINDPFEGEPEVTCELCGEKCGDRWEFIQDVIICSDCATDPEGTLDQDIEFYKNYKKQTK